MLKTALRIAQCAMPTKNGLLCVPSHIFTRSVVQGQDHLETKADLSSGPREQPGVGGAGREEEGGGTVAWRGGGKAHLEGGYLALKLRGLGSRGDIDPYQG